MYGQLLAYQIPELELGVPVSILITPVLSAKWAGRVGRLYLESFHSCLSGCCFPVSSRRHEVYHTDCVSHLFAGISLNFISHKVSQHIDYLYCFKFSLDQSMGYGLVEVVQLSPKVYEKTRQDIYNKDGCKIKVNTCTNASSCILYLSQVLAC